MSHQNYFRTEEEDKGGKVNIGTSIILLRDNYSGKIVIFVSSALNGMY